MRILLAIDDTDNVDSRGTGEIAALIAEAVQRNSWGVPGFITRHQLLVHPDIPYTSHNSAMCFPAEIGQAHLDELTTFCCRFLERECAVGSDPGLCIAVPDSIEGSDELIAFGRRAKEEVLTKQEALDLASRLGVHLSEHGGTGHGVIGALAGAALRLWGNDGRMRGRLKAPRPGELWRVRQLLEQPDVDVVRSVAGDAIDENELVLIADKPKTVMQGGASVLLLSERTVSTGEARWETLPRKLLRDY
jgi:hypothetical protein